MSISQYGEWIETKADRQPKKMVGKQKSVSVSQISGWTEITKRIKDRDNHECRICGCCANTRTLHVHHIDWDRGNNRDTNLVTLCGICHSSVHRSNYRPNQDDDYPAPWGDLTSEPNQGGHDLAKADV